MSYQRYLYPGSTQNVPRTTAYRKRKREQASKSEIIEINAGEHLAFRNEYN